MDIKLGGFTYNDVVTHAATYPNGSLALVLYNEHGAVATVSVLAELPADEGCIWVKNYSENAGVQEALIDAGVLKLTGRTTRVGYATVHEAEVLI